MTENIHRCMYSWCTATEQRLVICHCKASFSKNIPTWFMLTSEELHYLHYIALLAIVVQAITVHRNACIVMVNCPGQSLLNKCHWGSARIRQLRGFPTALSIGPQPNCHTKCASLQSLHKVKLYLKYYPSYTKLLTKILENPLSYIIHYIGFLILSDVFNAEPDWL